DLGERLLGGGDHTLDRAPEDFLPFELPARVSVKHSMVGIAPTHAAHAQSLTGFAVASQLLRQYTFLALALLQYHCSSAVAEQDGDVAIGPVHERRDQLRADHQGVA